jgi:hypothetical protein
MTLRRLLGLLALGLTALALVGCGGDTLSFDPVAKAASQTADSASSRVAFVANMSADGIGAMSFSGTGVYDGRTKSGSLNMKFNLPADAQAQLGGSPSMDMIFDGRHGLVMYMRSSMFRLGDTWVKMDVGKLAGKAGVDLSALMNANQADPSQTLTMLMASSDAHVVNYDRVRGVFTTHYTLEIDLKELAKKNKDLRDSFEQIMKISGIDSYPAEAWIDDQGNVRRIKIDMSFNMPTGQAFTMSITEELYDFGVRVNIKPPTGHVVDMSALLKAAG